MRLQTISRWPSGRKPVLHPSQKPRLRRKSRRSVGSCIVFVERLVILLNKRINLLNYLWIGHVIHSFLLIFGRNFIAAVVDRYLDALLRQLQRDPSTYASRAPGN
jgi:hypothetical protein